MISIRTILLTPFLLLLIICFSCSQKEVPKGGVDRPAIADYVLAPESTEVLPTRAYVSYSDVTIQSSVLQYKDEEAVLIDTTTLDAGGLIIDFGKIVGGRLHLDFNAVEGGAEIRVDYAESSDFILEGGDCPIRWTGPVPHTATLEPEAATWEAPDIIGGFRFARIVVDQGTVSLDRAAVVFTSYLGTEDTLEGYFLSSDDDLNRIWYAGVYTLDLCTIDSLHGDFFANQRIAPEPGWVYVDGAKRDRMVWTADLYVESIAGMVSHFDPDIVLRSLRALASEQFPSGYIPAASPFGFGKIIGIGFGDYTAWWVRILWSYYVYTGDEGPLKDLFPVVVSAMRFLESQRGDSGLIEVGEENSFDWCYSLIREGASTYDNAIYILALRDAARIARVNKDEESALKYQDLRAKIRQRLRDLLFDTERGVFVDTTVDADHVPLDGNALALYVDDLLTDAEKGTILDYFQENMWLEWGSATVDRPYAVTRQDDPYHNRRVWPFIVYLEAEGRFKMDRDDSVLNLIKRTWLSMLDYEGSGTYWEWIGPGVVPEDCYVSLVHGVSSGVTALLSGYVLGVRPVRPGYNTFSVDPHPLGLGWFEGAVPTTTGPIKISYDTAGGRGSMHVDFPTRIEPDPVTPFREPIDRLYLNGKLYWERGGGD